MTGPSGADAARLQARADRERRELGRLRSRAAARSVTDLATGVLMEQLRCGPAEARRQLARLAGESGHSVEALAAQITGQPEPAAGDTASAVTLDWAGIPNAPDAAALAATLLDEALAPVGAAAVALWAAEPDGGLDLAGQAGLGELAASRWRRIHPDMRTLVQEAAAGAEIWRPSGIPADDDRPAIGLWPGGARALLPLSRRGVPEGCMVVWWPEPLEGFSQALRRQLAALADLAGQALDMNGPAGGQSARHRAFWIFGLLDALLEGFWFARPVSGDDGAVTDFRIVHASGRFGDVTGQCDRQLTGRQLLEAVPQAALAGGLFDASVTALATGQPQHLSGDLVAAQHDPADRAATPAVAVAPLYDGVAVAWRETGDAGRLATLLQHAQRLGRIGGWEENLRTGEVHWTEYTFALFGQEPGQPVPISELRSRVVPDDIPAVDGFRDALLRERTESAAAFRVVRSDDGSVRQMRAYAEPVTDAAGALIAVRGAFQDISADYHTQLAFAAAREQLADTEQRAQDEHRLAERLQQAITPRVSEPVAAAGLDVVARYRPSGPGNLVSGDWYDTVLLPTKEVLVVVGDIAGHGLDAVTGMVAMRNALRGLAITGEGPAALLRWLNGAACHLTDGIIGTAVCGIYDPAGRSLRWARAGHLPPVLVRQGKAEALELPAGLMLGADPDGIYAEVTTSLRLGDVLLLFTDGLIERRDQPIDDALRSLLRIASRPVTTDVSSYADDVVAATSANTDDDACLVAIHVR